MLSFETLSHTFKVKWLSNIITFNIWITFLNRVLLVLVVSNSY